jgi:drug/metabolite transporter (DMT)-like permease
MPAIHRRSPYLALFGTLVLFSILTSILYGLIGGGRLRSAHIVAYALPFSIVSLLVGALASGQRSALSRLFERANLLTLAGMGLLSPFLYFLLVTAAFTRLGEVGRTDEAYVLNATWPVLMVLFSVLIADEKLTARTGVALAMGFCGILYILTGGNFTQVRLSDWRGDLTALVAASVFGLYSALLRTPGLKRLFNDMGSTVAVLGFQTFSFTYALIYLLATTLLGITRPVIPSWFELGLLAMAGGGSFGFAYVFYYYARSSLNAATVAGFMFFLPFLALLFLRIFSGDWAIEAYWIGLFVIGAAALLQTPLFDYLHHH